MDDSYYIVYSNIQKRIYWFMKKQKADNANLKAIKNYIENHKKEIIGQEIFLNKEKADKIKYLLAKNSMWAALEIIKKENPNAIPIKYDENLVSSLNI
jgi:hypothetical protein